MALATNRRYSCRGAGRPRAFPIAAGVHFFQGALASIRRQVGTGAGFAKLAATNATTVEEFAGVVYGEVDNSGGVAGDKKVQVETEGEFLLDFPEETLTQADVGAKAYAAGDDELTLESTNNPYVGRITEVVSATEAFVDIKAFAV